MGLTIEEQKYKPQVQDRFNELISLSPEIRGRYLAIGGIYCDMTTLDIPLPIITGSIAAFTHGVKCIPDDIDLKFKELTQDSWEILRNLFLDWYSLGLINLPAGASAEHFFPLHPDWLDTSNFADTAFELNFTWNQSLNGENIEIPIDIHIRNPNDSTGLIQDGEKRDKYHVIWSDGAKSAFVPIDDKESLEIIYLGQASLAHNKLLKTPNIKYSNDLYCKRVEKLRSRWNKLFQLIEIDCNKTGELFSDRIESVLEGLWSSISNPAIIENEIREILFNVIEPEYLDSGFTTPLSDLKNWSKNPHHGLPPEFLLNKSQ